MKKGSYNGLYIIPVRAARKFFHHRAGELAHAGDVGDAKRFFLRARDFLYLLARSRLRQVFFDYFQFFQFFLRKFCAAAFCKLFGRVFALLCKPLQDNDRIVVRNFLGRLLPLCNKLIGERGQGTPERIHAERIACLHGSNHVCTDFCA